MRAVRAAIRAATGLVVAAGAAVLLIGGALVVSNEVGTAAEPVGAPRRPPILAPAVPPGAPEHLALWSYLEKVNQAWGRDWPTVIDFLEDFWRRYPGNLVARDALYAAYIERGKELREAGDLAGARRSFQQAADFDEDRGEAHLFLDELDKDR